MDLPADRAEQLVSFHKAINYERRLFYIQNIDTLHCALKSPGREAAANRNLKPESHKHARKVHFLKFN